MAGKRIDTYPVAGTAADTDEVMLLQSNGMGGKVLRRETRSTLRDSLLTEAALLDIAEHIVEEGYIALDIPRSDISSVRIPFRAFIVTGNAAAGDAGAGALYIRGTSAGPRAIQDAAGMWFELSCGGVADLGHFGAVLDGSSADAALDTAYDYLMSRPDGGTIIFRSGEYRFNAEHSIHPTVPLALHFERGAKVYCGLSGADKVMWKATHPDGETRGKSLLISGHSQVEFHSSVTGIGALFFEYLNASDLKFYGSGHNWVHYRNNSAVRLSGTWNCDLEPLTIWGAGHRKPRHDTGSVTFTISSASTSLSASGAVFAAGDVGDVIVVGDEAFTISVVTDSTNATVVKAATQDITAQRGSFGGVRATTVSGNTTVTLDAAVAVASDIGRAVYIGDARTMFGAGSPKRAHRATIAAVTDSTHIVLDVAPTISASSVEIVFSPAVEIFGDTAEGNELNDLVWYGLHLEEIYGTGLVVQGGGNMFFPNLKLHANNYGANSTATDYCGWFDDVTSSIDGDFEGITVGRLGRMVVSGLIGCMAIGSCTGIAVRRQPLVHARSMGNAGVVSIGNWYLGNQIDDATFGEAFKLVGGGRFQQTGRVFGYNRAATVYPQVSGPRPPAGFLPNTTEAITSLAGNVRAVLLSTSTPTYAGASVGGAVDAPTATAEYAAGVQLSGMALAPSGTAAIDIAQITAVARSPSGSVVAGQWDISTRDTAGTLATRWSFVAAGHLLPAADNAHNIGWASGRVKEIFCANATINTSDQREKQDIGAIPDAWLDAWGDVQWQRFRWRDAVAEKGEGARWHVGLIAQEIDAAFTARGFDASAIGLLCYDEWAEEPAAPAVLDDDGNESLPAREGRPAGSRWGVRYSECAALEAAWVRRALATSRVG